MSEIITVRLSDYPEKLYHKDLDIGNPGGKWFSFDAFGGFILGVDSSLDRVADKIGGGVYGYLRYIGRFYDVDSVTEINKCLFNSEFFVDDPRLAKRNFREKYGEFLDSCIQDSWDGYRRINGVVLVLGWYELGRWKS